MRNTTSLLKRFTMVSAFLVFSVIAPNMANADDATAKKALKLAKKAYKLAQANASNSQTQIANSETKFITLETNLNNINNNLSNIGNAINQNLAEVQAIEVKLQKLQKAAWGFVVASGVGFHASSNNLQVTHPATGVYCVIVDSGTGFKAAQVTSGSPQSKNIVSIGTGNGSLCNSLDTTTTDVVPVYITKADGNPVDENFVIFIPPPAL